MWRERLETTQFPAYVGQHVFEDVVQQAYARFQDRGDLPLAGSWGRWEGRDRTGKALEVDIVARLLDGTMMTGSATIRKRPADATVLLRHLRDLERLADSGKGWAREAMKKDAPKLFVSASGFKDSFAAAAKDSGHRVIRWTIEDLF